jgi:hypothetical protein
MQTRTEETHVTDNVQTGARSIEDEYQGAQEAPPETPGSPPARQSDSTPPGQTGADARAAEQPGTMMKEVKISDICIDGEFQVRDRTVKKQVQRYAELMQDGTQLPPPVIFDDGQTRWLADGKHRLLATQKNGGETITAEVRPGTERDAYWYGVQVNAVHGLPLTNAEKRRAVDLMLTDPEWQAWSDRAIARQCGVSNGFVSRRRKKMTVSGTQSSTKRKVNRDGQTVEMNTANIGKTPRAAKQADAQTARTDEAKDSQPATNHDPQDLDAEAQQASSPTLGQDQDQSAPADSPERGADGKPGESPTSEGIRDALVEAVTTCLQPYRETTPDVIEAAYRDAWPVINAWLQREAANDQ